MMMNNSPKHLQVNSIRIYIAFSKMEELLVSIWEMKKIKIYSKKELDKPLLMKSAFVILIFQSIVVVYQ